MATTEQLVPAKELARRNGVRFPNESAEYRQARDALLAEEIELRRHIERVAQQRRALPPGGDVTGDYRFEGEDGPGGLRRPLRRQADAGRLQLHVRAEARAALPDMHVANERMGRRGSRHRAARRVRNGGALADRAARRVQEERGWTESQALSDTLANTPATT